MNITDVEIPEEIPGDIIRAIFDRQKELIEKYDVIEKNNGFLVLPYPVDLQDKHAQSKLKDFAWRITEEFAESTGAHSDEHRLEELIDALHFFVELNILSGYYPSISYDDVYLLDTDEPHPYLVIESIGMAMNCLKNKPWKQTHMLTDVKKYYLHLYNAWCEFFRLLKSEGLTEEDLYILYYKKATVNKFRQRSKY
jgi:hypothetical protein